MSDTFFVSWQLWEQMTFVLAGAIVLVFCLGWARLWWVSRRNKRTALVDEEKKIKIQHLRKSGIIIKLDRENHIPFGIRALQSGLEIDGIWVSTSKTPIPESLRQLRESENFSDSSFGSNHDGRPLSPAELSPPRIPFSGPLKPAFQPDRTSMEYRKTLEAFQPSTLKTLSRDVTGAYKPRRSSHLRFSSSGNNQVNHDALAQLEGVAPMIADNRCHERKLYLHAATTDSSSDAPADNERSSGSYSDSSLNGTEVIPESQKIVRAISSGAASKKSRMSRCHSHYTSDDSATSVQLQGKGDYFSVPPDSPPGPKINPFATPETSPILGSIATRDKVRSPTDVIEPLGETRWPLLSKISTELPTEPVFTPGTLHANKRVRKINSGFELLPAGTFELSSGTIKIGTDGTIASAEFVDGDVRRQSKKLQKRGRDCITGKRVSTASGKF